MGKRYVSYDRYDDDAPTMVLRATRVIQREFTRGNCDSATIRVMCQYVSVFGVLRAMFFLFSRAVPGVEEVLRAAGWLDYRVSGAGG